MTPEDKKALISALAEAMKDEHMLNSDEREWVRLAIRKDAQAIKLREAIIEKTLGGLAWAALVGFGYLLLNFFQHGGKP